MQASAPTSPSRSTGRFSARRLATALLPGWLLALVMTSGCATATRSKTDPSEADARRHIIRVNEKGQLLALDGTLAPTDYAETHLLAPLRQALTLPTRYGNGVLIFVHGGLNDYDSAYEHFRTRFGDLDRANYYPLFVIWPSDLKKTYFEHLLEVRQGRQENGSWFSRLTVPIVLAQDLATGLVRSPMTTLQTMRSDLQTTVPLGSDFSLVDKNVLSIYRKLSDDHEHVNVGSDYKSSAEMFGRSVSYWATVPTKIATAGPIIDALGRPAWDDMLRRTYMVFPGRLTDNQKRDSEALVDVTRTKRQAEVKQSSFSTIVTALEEFQSKNKFPLTLVGHSMGAIVLNHLLDATTLEAYRIVYLAAACSVRDYAISVLPYLVAHPKTFSYNLSLHPMAEDGEWQKNILDLPPRGSLLVWIDNFLSNPVHEQDRTFGRWTNLFLQSPTGNSVIEDILHHRGVENRIYFRAYGIGSGDHPRRAAYQWSDPATTSPEKPALNTPDRHGAMASIDFWRDDVLKGMNGTP